MIDMIGRIEGLCTEFDGVGKISDHESQERPTLLRACRTWQPRRWPP